MLDVRVVLIHLISAFNFQLAAFELSAFSLSSLRSLRLNMLSAFDFSGSWMFDVERSMFVLPVDPFDFSVCFGRMLNVKI